VPPAHPGKAARSARCRELARYRGCGRIRYAIRIAILAGELGRAGRLAIDCCRLGLGNLDPATKQSVEGRPGARPTLGEIPGPAFVRYRSRQSMAAADGHRRKRNCPDRSSPQPPSSRRGGDRGRRWGCGPAPRRVDAARGGSVAAAA